MEPLHDALQSNYFGALRMQELAKECRNLICMVHVSSALVNSNQPHRSFIEEKCYEPKIDPELLVPKIMSMNPQELEIEQPKILASMNFANTYTFCKNMSEIVLQRRRGNMRFTILRPSSINACFQEPFPGWVD